MRGIVLEQDWDRWKQATFWQHTTGPGTVSAENRYSAKVNFGERQCCNVLEPSSREGAGAESGGSLVGGSFEDVALEHLDEPMPDGSTCWGLGFKVYGLGYRDRGLGDGVQCLGYMV